MYYTAADAHAHVLVQPRKTDSLNIIVFAAVSRLN